MWYAKDEFESLLLVDGPLRFVRHGKYCGVNDGERVGRKGAHMAVYLVGIRHVSGWAEGKTDPIGFIQHDNTGPGREF